MKKKLRTLETDWWNQIIDECAEAARNGDIGSMYKVLRKIGSRHCKPYSGTTLTTDEFKKHFEKVTKDRYEVEPSHLMASVEQMPNRSQEEVCKVANNKLNKVPTATEIMQSMKGGSKWLLEFLSNEYAKIPAKKRSFLVWFENFEALFPSNPAISQANMLRKPIPQKISLPSALGIL